MGYKNQMCLCYFLFRFQKSKSYFCSIRAWAMLIVKNFSSIQNSRVRSFHDIFFWLTVLCIHTYTIYTKLNLHERPCLILLYGFSFCRSFNKKKPFIPKISFWMYYSLFIFIYGSWKFEVVNLFGSWTLHIEWGDQLPRTWKNLSLLLIYYEYLLTGITYCGSVTTIQFHFLHIKA